jgi:DNA-3-methyladenine glycosylase II
MSSQIFFPYGKKETDYLASKDPVLGEVIRRVGHISRPVNTDLFEALLNAVTGQQISSKAHATVWRRMKERFSPLTPGHICLIPAEELQSCGITMKKANYIKEAAARIADDRFDLSVLPSLPDEEVCHRLCSLPGVGIWTAEMLMIFSMLRPDIISRGDLAILRGLRIVYGLEEITPELFQEYKRRYSPYATVASLYLWAAAAGAAGKPNEKTPP